MGKRTGQLLITGFLIAAVLIMASLAGGMVWKRQTVYKEVEIQKPSTEVTFENVKEEVTSQEVSEAEETEAEAETEPEPSRDVTLLFGGDVYFSDYVLNAYDQAGGIAGVLDEGIRNEIHQADIFMVNQEFPFTIRGTAAEDKQFTFRIPPERISILQEMEVDIVTLANNHILDFGIDGLLDSCQALDEAGIIYVGGGADLDRARELKTLQVA